MRCCRAATGANESAAAAATSPGNGAGTATGMDDAASARTSAAGTETEDAASERTSAEGGGVVAAAAEEEEVEKLRWAAWRRPKGRARLSAWDLDSERGAEGKGGVLCSIEEKNACIHKSLLSVTQFTPLYTCAVTTEIQIYMSALDNEPVIVKANELAQSINCEHRASQTEKVGLVKAQDDDFIDLNLPLDDGAINFEAPQYGGFNLYFEHDTMDLTDELEIEAADQGDDDSDVMGFTEETSGGSDGLEMEAPAQGPSRRKDATDEVRKLIYQTLLARSSNGRLGKRVTHKVASQFSLHIRTAQDIWKRGKESLA
uniref:DUF7769 domain-containing protein n=1 Tax=Oryza brachyantha TaxID=4533 RepID=J3LJ96_ORYBR